MSVPVVISAAGRGTRMKQLSQDKPKHLIGVAGRPFLAYLLDNLRAAGYHELYLVIGYQAPAAYKFVEQHSSIYPLLVVNQFDRLGEERYGTLMPLQAVTPELRGRPVLAVNGDNLYSSRDLASLGACLTSTIAGLEHDHAERYGVLVPRTTNQLVLERILEKPSQPPSRLINVGLYYLGSAIWDLIPQVGISARGEYELTDAVNLLAANEPVAIRQLQDFWLDFGRPEDVAAAEAMLQGALSS